ncbi:Crp/Fnr family transcriptional regulator [Pseudomonadota bacterium]
MIEQANIQQIDKLIAEYCSSHWRELLEENKETTTYSKGRYIFREGQEAKRIKIIIKGKAKVFLTYKTGREQIVRLAANGQIVGHRGFGGDHYYSVSCKTLEDTTVAHIPLELFQEALMENNQFCYQFMMFFAEELRASEYQLKSFTNLDVRQRMAEALIYNLKTFGYDRKRKKILSHTLSRKNFSCLIGATYESVVRVLSDFDKSGVIQILNKDIKILKSRELDRIRKGV